VSQAGISPAIFLLSARRQNAGETRHEKPASPVNQMSYISPIGCIDGMRWGSVCVATVWGMALLLGGRMGENRFGQG
jgi:hypothetical protein